MHILNLHERRLRAADAAARVGALIDALSSQDDRLWPADRWPAMRFDRPLSVGATGGHGPIRYRVTALEPGRRVVFEFNAKRGPAVGFHGSHRFELQVDAPDDVVLRHVLEARCAGMMALRWTFVFRPLHDALIEDALDNAELALAGRVERPANWSGWVRALRRLLGRG